MPVVAFDRLMSEAKRGGYAIGYFESWNLESLQGVLDAAEAARSPVIIGCNGEFLSHRDRIAPERIEWHAALLRNAAETSRAPCGLILNECGDDTWLRRGVDLGFGLVMPIAGQRISDVDATYRTRVRSLVNYAHARQVAVEAELGELPCPAAGMTCIGAATDPEEAERFVADTAVDILAISVGNVHVGAGACDLDLDRLTGIAARVRIPLALHGGSGISSESLRPAIHLGIAKVNYGTCLKRAFLAALRKALDCDEENPHALLGMGGASDLLVAGRQAVRDEALARMADLGCVGRA